MSQGTERTARRRRFEHLAAIGVLAALTVAFFFPVIFQAKSITVVRSFEPVEYPWRAVEAPRQLAIQSDEADLSYPWQVDLTRAVHEGTIPLWDPDGFVGGYPLYSNGSSAELYPLRLLPALVMSPAEAQDLMCILEVFFAGFFAYLFLRELEVGVVAGIFGGVAWMFCSFNMAWLQFDVVSPIQMLFPLGLFAVHRSWRKSTWTSALLAGVVFGVTMISGHIVWLAITCVICGVYAFALGAGSAVGAWREGDSAAATHFIAIPMLTVLSAAGVSAIGLLPAIDGLAASQRHTFPYSYLGGYVAEDASYGLSPHSVFAHLFYPYKTPLTIEGINLEMIFSGTATAVFGVIGLFSRRPGTALAKWLLFALLLVAVGTPASWLAYHAIPLLRVLWPYGRLFQWASMGLVVLGAVGLDRTLARAATVRVGSDRVRAVAVGALGFAVVACTAFQLIPLGRDLNPPFTTLTKANTFPATGLVKAMEAYTRSGPWPSRILPVSSEAPFGGGLVLAPGNFGLLYGVDLVDGYDSVVPQRIAAVDRFVEGAAPNQVSSLQFEAFAILPIDSEVRYDELQRFGISALATAPADTATGAWGDLARLTVPETGLYAGPDGNLIQLGGPSAGPRVVDQVTEVDSAKAAFDAFTAPAYPWTTAVVLERSQLRRLPSAALQAATQPGTTPLSASVASVKGGINSLSMTVTSNRAGLVVIPEDWDPGWSAEVNGRAEPVLEGNYLQQVVAVPAGTSHLVLRYRPQGLDLGAFVTGATVVCIVTFVLVVVLVGVRRKRRLRAAGAPSEAPADEAEPIALPPVEEPAPSYV